MMTESQFNDAARDLAELNGIPVELAAELLVNIGDTPEVDAEGLALARSEDGTEHRVKLPSEE